LFFVFRLGFTVRVILAEFTEFIAIAFLAIFALQLFASTPPHSQRPWIMVVLRYPELFHAFIVTGQML
jgi:hypothetical protein